MDNLRGKGKKNLFTHEGVSAERRSLKAALYLCQIALVGRPAREQMYTRPCHVNSFLCICGGPASWILGAVVKSISSVQCQGCWFLKGPTMLSVNIPL